jgi:hypothetical protein
MRNREGIEVTIDRERQQIDEGKVRFYTYNLRGSTAVRVLRIKTGALPVWFRGILGAGLATPYKIVEGVTISTEGTEKTLRNPKRRLGDAGFSVKVFTGATYTGGTAIKESQVGFGTVPGQAKSGENVSFWYEFLPDTEYIIDLAPTAETDTVMDIYLEELA